MKKKKDKTYAFRVNSTELSKIKTLAKRTKLTVTQITLSAVLLVKKLW